ncbi:hypothetical protein BpHYR1_002573 [Brachionus plicatilis]|uniref:Uncharacterized protein n=1 Tax=Brachionus plicatilis TaxID=10195 RepID=A0A3M7RGL7_BRAPC|nr:hypothetical protein BpHYR1_002573 [Brachionus plicatilis]
MSFAERRHTLPPECFNKQVHIVKDLIGNINVVDGCMTAGFIFVKILSVSSELVLMRIMTWLEIE